MNQAGLCSPDADADADADAAVGADAAGDAIAAVDATGAIPAGDAIGSGDASGSVVLACAQPGAHGVGAVLAVRPGVLGGRPVVVSTGEDRRFRVWALPTEAIESLGESKPNRSDDIALDQTRDPSPPVTALQQLTASPPHDQVVRGLAVVGGRDGLRVLTADDAGHLTRWRVRASREPTQQWRRRPFAHACRAVDTSADGQLVVVGGKPGPPMLVSFAEFAPINAELGDQPAHCAAYQRTGPEAGQIAVGGEGFLRVFTWQHGSAHEAVLSGDSHTQLVRSVAFADVNGAGVLVSGGNDETVRIWGTRTGILRRVVETPSFVRCVTATRVGSTALVAAGCEDGQVLLIDALTGEIRWQSAELGARIWSVAFLDDGRRSYLISADGAGSIRVWRIPPPPAAPGSHPGTGSTPRAVAAERR